MTGKVVEQVRGVVGERVVLSTRLDPYLTLKALAAYAGIGYSTLQRLRHAGLPHYRVAGEKKLLVRASEFDIWMQQWRRQTERQRDAVDAVLRSLGGWEEHQKRSQRVSEALARMKARRQADGTWAALCARRAEIARETAARRRLEREGKAKKK